MATSSSSSSHCEFDVFLSFRGKDTRDNFTSHLYDALCRRRIRTFIDNDLERGEEITPSLLRTIEESKISIVIFSKNYASSPWCVDELVKILECKETSGQIVLPVFYHVDPSNVEEQSGSFADALMDLENNFKEKMVRIPQWRTHLTKAASISGWDSQVIRPESKLVNEIVETVLKKLNCSPSYTPDGLVGMDSRIEQVKDLLCIGSPDVLVVGLWGMGGIGKTTIARAIFNSISGQYEGCCFLANVRKQSGKHGGLFRLRNELFREILNDKYLQVADPDIGYTFTQERLQRTKILVVLDDVNDAAQVQFLLGRREWFGYGSRVIITTRNKQFLTDTVDAIYEVKGLTFHESLQLLSLCAFKEKRPPQDYLELSVRALYYAQGNPLALQVLGSLLLNWGKQEWESALDKLDRFPQPRVNNVLRLSFDALDDEEKSLFLDIACFFKGKSKIFAKRILDGCGFSTDLGIGVLTDKCLITGSSGLVEMHDMLEEMAHEIVRHEANKNPGKRSRIWCPLDVCKVLTKNLGTEEVEGIFFDTLTINPIEINAGAFSGMFNLRLLKIYNSGDQNICKVNLPLGLEYLSEELRYLHWDLYPLKSLPCNFCPQNLVQLNLPYSNIEQLWNGVQGFVSLKQIDLSHSAALVGIPDLSDAKNLESLNLEGCTSLLDVSSIQYLQKLDYLNLKNCSNLRNLPCRMHVGANGFFNLAGCSSLTKLPEISGSVQHLDFSGTAIEQLPSSIGFLQVQWIRLQDCRRLKILPSSIHKWKFLDTLCLSGCLNLSEFPESNDSNVLEVRYLQLDGTGIEQLPSLVGCLTGLVRLDLQNCTNLKHLPNNICKLKGLSKFNLSGCCQLESFPDIPEIMESLEELDLSNTALKELPPTIENLNGLSRLTLKNCVNLSKLPENIGNLISLKQELDLSKCNLLKIPASIGSLHSLECLDISGNNFENLPGSIKLLSRLTKLLVKSCKCLKSLPELPPHLEHLDAGGCISLEAVQKCTLITEDWFKFRTIRSVDNFVFANCFKLDQNAYSNIMQDGQQRIQRMANESLEYYQEFASAPVSFCLPGSGIPKWFSYENVGCSLTIKLPQDSGGRKFLGFVHCIVASENYSGYSGLSVRFKYHFKSNDNDRDDLVCHTFNSSWKGKSKFSGSNHLLIWYSLAHRNLHKRAFKGYRLGECFSKYGYKEVEFEFTLVDEKLNPSQCCKIKRCGVCLLYARELSTATTESNSDPIYQEFASTG